ncbi:MAG: hypothetical protein NVS3B28_26710 [Candidatus Velthaea sp.]
MTGSLIFCYGLAMLGVTLAAKIANLSAVVVRASEFVLLIPLIAIAFVIRRHRRAQAGAMPAVPQSGAR